jgi:hydrogenase nickel incorporation protein HypA/HybF
MHEMGLLAPVVKAASDACVAAGARSVTVVKLRVGSMNSEAPGSLDDAWPMAVAGSPAEGARLLVEEVPAAVWCSACQAEREIDAFYALRCPRCNTPTGELVHGREFEVAYVELDVPDHP